MKLRDVAKGTWAVRPVLLRLANAVEAPVPGQPPSGAPATIKVGVRVLLGAETVEVYEKAQQLAKSRGVPEWKDTNPICRQYEMALTVLVAVVDVDQETGAAVGGGEPQAFFDSVDQILTSILIGTDNIAYLYEQWVRWQDENSALRGAKRSFEDVIGAIILDMEAPDSPDSPLLGMGHATLVSSLRLMGGLLLNSQTVRSLSGSPDAGSSTPKSKDQPENGLETSSSKLETSSVEGASSEA